MYQCSFPLVSHTENFFPFAGQNLHKAAVAENYGVIRNAARYGVVEGFV